MNTSRIILAFSPLKITSLRKNNSLSIKRRRLGIGQSEEQREAARLDYHQRIEETTRKQFLQDRVIRIEESSSPEINQDDIDTSGYDGWLKD